MSKTDTERKGERRIVLISDQERDQRRFIDDELNRLKIRINNRDLFSTQGKTTKEKSTSIQRRDNIERGKGGLFITIEWREKCKKFAISHDGIDEIMFVDHSILRSGELFEKLLNDR